MPEMPDPSDAPLRPIAAPDVGHLSDIKETEEYDDSKPGPLDQEDDDEDEDEDLEEFMDEDEDDEDDDKK